MTAETTTDRLISGAELAQMGDIGPCELVAGRIVPMAPTGFDHADYEFAIGTALRVFVHSRNLGRVVGGEVGIYTRRNPDTVRSADVLYISHERLAQRTAARFLDVAPELVVEVRSPDQPWRAIQEKVGEYFAIDVLLVWVIDPAQRGVRVYHGPEQVQELGAADTLTGAAVLPGFWLPVVEIFT